jgi:hypothetical protein
MRSSQYDIFVWCSDFEDFRGEGILARLFLKKISSSIDKKFFVKTPGSTYLVYKKKIHIVKKKKFNINFFNKYFILFYGIFLIWINHKKKIKTIYVNYLPLWNFSIFILLPKKTILGPITGGGFFFNVGFFENVIRKFLFSLFYFISINLIYTKFKNVIFSTNLLNKYICQKYKKNFNFNFCLLNFRNLRSFKNKNIDFLIYYKINSTKNPVVLKNIINFLTYIGLKVVVVGDRIESKNAIFFKNLKRDRLLYLLKKTKFTIISNENFYSLFCIDAISCNVQIFFDKRIKPTNLFFSKLLCIPLDFENLQRSENIIKFNLMNYKFQKCCANNSYYSQIEKINNSLKKISETF